MSRGVSLGRISFSERLSRITAADVCPDYIIFLASGARVETV